MNYHSTNICKKHIDSTDELIAIRKVTSATKPIVEPILDCEANREGRNRNPYDWTYSNITLSNITDRGFTGHEHMTNFGLINMNGRVYDPYISQFLSPDPFVQDPTNTQNYNRFSYVLNNPLKYTDPSGYIVNDDIPCASSGGNNIFKDFFKGIGSFFGDIGGFFGDVFGSMEFTSGPGSDASLSVGIPFISFGDGVGSNPGLSQSASIGGGFSGSALTNRNNPPSIYNVVKEDPPRNSRFSNIRTDFNYNKSQWNYVDALYLKDLGVVSIDLPQDVSISEINELVMGFTGIAFFMISTKLPPPFSTVFSGYMAFTGAIIGGQYAISQRIGIEYQNVGSNQGVYVLNVKKMGEVSSAAFFDAVTGVFLGWHDSSIKGAPTITHQQYLQFLK